ncbi:MAG TPA: hypothetical protein VMK12_33120 [Anaeromyxobacteraceae bacterium]|nr:hypothetical protein [Anaeromyxobacteraceae bacterium]
MLQKAKELIAEHKQQRPDSQRLERDTALLRKFVRTATALTGDGGSHRTAAIAPKASPNPQGERAWSAEKATQTASKTRPVQLGPP